MTSVRVFAPATVSNVGPGFDVLGFALHRPGDTVEAWTDAVPGVTIVAITGDGGVLPLDGARNAAGAAAAAVLREAPRRPGRTAPTGLALRLHKGLPLQSGLGSSGASAAAGAAAANELLGRPFTPAGLVAFAMEGERAACGFSHADNVAPALLGGFVLVRSYDPLDLVRLPVPDGLAVAVVHPHCDVSTRQARAMLADRQVPLAQVVANTGNVAGLVAALFQSDLPLLGRSVQDQVVEPLRARLIPGYAGVRQAALDAGALACAISGSGPTLCALAEGDDVAARAAQAMRAAFRRHAGLESDAWVGGICPTGARVVN
jgi:homoserine kinase